MVIVCPLMTNPQVAREFNELKEAVGENAAYNIWSLNNGNSIDKAPNGEPSILFNSLLERLGGDRRQAIIAKAKMYSASFRNSFGDWCSAKVEYYGPTMGKTTAAKTNKRLVDFDDIVREDIKQLAEKQGKTVRQVKMESGKEYEDLLIDKINEFRNNPENFGKTLLVSNAVLSTHNELFDNTPQIPSKEEFVKRQVERSEDTTKTKEELTVEAEQYYDDLLARNPNLQINDQYVTDIKITDFGIHDMVHDTNGEPVLDTLPSRYYLNENEEFVAETEEQSQFFEHLEQAILDEPRLIQAVSEKMSNYITSNMMLFNSENLNATEDEKYQRTLDLKKQFLKDYVKTKMNVIINNLMSNVGHGETANIRKKFVDSLKEAVENNDLSAIDTFVTMIANDALGISIESNVHSVIAKYIEQFSDSEAIQNALTVLNDETGQSTPRLMRNLADYVWEYYNTGNLKRNIRDAIFNMLYKLNNLLHGVFKGLTKRQNREFVVKEIYQYFAARQVLDAQQDEQLVHDMKMWTKKFDILKVTLDKVVSKIKDGIDSRIAAIKSVTGSAYDEKEYNNLLSWSVQLQEIKEMPQGQDKEDSERVAIEKFINNGINELAKVVQTLDQFNNSEVNLDNLPQLIRMKSQVIGFYQNIVNQYITKYIYGSNDNYFDPSTAIGMHLSLIQQRMQIIKNNYDNQLLRYTSAIIDKCADETVDIGDKERFKTNAKLWLMNKIGDGDLSFLESFVGPASSSISPVIRILDWYTRQANHIKHTEALARGQKLLALYNKCKPLWDTISPGNFMRKFCEMDENGRPTGRFRSQIKEGLFRKKRQEAIDKLRKKYKATIQDGKVLFLDESGNEDWDREKKYLDELDDVLYQLGQIRQYTPQYYKDKRSFLSKDTQLRIDTINKHIRQLQYKFTKEITVDGKKLILPDTSKLSNSDAELLKQLQEQKQNLSSFYNIIKDSNGYIVSFEKKTGDDLRMAQEITNWNTFKRGKLKYYGNEQLFTKAYESIVQQFGKDSQEAKRFLYENSTVKATDEWFEKLTSESAEQSDEVYELRSRRNAILRNIMVNKEGLFRDKYDFSKLNDDALAELREIETRLDEITEHVQHSDSYKDFVRTRTAGMNYGKTGDSMSFLDRELQRIQNLYPGDQRKLMELYFDKYYFTNSKGEQVPMSIFSTIVPSQEEDIDRYSPTGVFVELLSWSEYADTRWQYHSQDQIQFDKTKDEYIDKEFSEFVKDKDIKAFYDELLSIMNDAWKMLPAINRTDNLLMPQRRDRSSHLITRFGLAPMRGILSNMCNINENDTNFNEELSTMPDGTVVETIPIRWVKRLDDPTAISTDIVGSVMDFYEMAVNFREKQVVAALGEAIKLQTMGGITKERHTGQSEYIENYNSMFIYGRMIKPLGSNKRKMTKMEKLITRFLQNIRSYAHTKLMAHNLVGIVKNGIDSFSSIIAEAVGGKYFDTHMMWKSMGYMAKEFFGGQLWALGNTKTRSFTAAAMQFNGAHGSIHEMFHHHNESWFRRILSAHLCMGEYTLIDYTFTGLLTNMIYCSYKYMVNPNTGQREFMNKEKAKWEYVRAGFSKKDAIDAFKREKTTLRDAYEVINGVFTLKPEYEDVIRPKKDSTEKRSVKLETRISQAIQERSAIVNGVLTEMDRSKLHSNYIGALVAQMRGWMISQQADYNRTGHDFALYSDEDKELTKKNISTLLTKMMGVNSGEYNIVEEDEDLLGQYNFTTGTVDRGCWISLLSAYKHAIGGLFGVSMLTDNERYAIRRMNACVMSVVILSLLSFGIGRSIEGDDDDTPYWLHWVKMQAYVSIVSAIPERESQIGYLAFIPVVGDILNSPAIAKAWIDDLDWVYQFPIDAFKSLYVYCSGDKTYGDPANTVIKGKNSFAGYTELEKSGAMAASEFPEINKIGIHNIFKNMSDEGMKAKERYYYDKIFGTNLIAYQAQWNKEPTEQKGIYGVLESTGVLKKQIKPKTSKKQKPKTSSRTVSRTSNRTSTRTHSR